MTRVSLARLPIFACAGLIGVLFAITVWNLAVERAWPKLRVRSATPLWGVPAPKPPSWTVDAFLSGDLQRAVSTSLGQSLPVFPLAVRAKNQFLYSVFHESGAPNIVVGKERELFESFYVDEFCGRGAQPDPVAVAAWADGVRETQTLVEAKGKRFVYLISPSKAARYSHYLPERLYCASLAKGTTEKLAAYRQALEARGVAFVDGASLTTAAMPDYPIDLFPRGGTHWNYLGSAISTRELTRTLNADGKASPIPRYDFQWREAPEALGTDRDLLNLLNLVWPDAKYPTASIQGRSLGVCAKAPRLLAVGGSFLVEVIANLVEASPCAAQADYWHYVRKAPGEYGRKRFLVDNQGGGAQLREHGFESVEDFESSLAQADVVLLEENESVIANMGQNHDLLAAARK